MNDEWLQLTEEDIERAHQMMRSRPSTPTPLEIGDKITIGPDDIPLEELHTEVQSRMGDIITITEDDLSPTPPLPETSTEMQELEILMFNLLNEERRAHLPGWLNTSRLKWHDDLAAVARGHSADMINRHYVAHISPEGITTARRIEAFGVKYVACGENIGVFYGDKDQLAQAVYDIHNAFMNQPRSLTNHRGNIINPIWTHAGIGIAVNPAGSLVATQNFISAPKPLLRGR
jgi:uncharacterized protein YkwD